MIDVRLLRGDTEVDAVIALSRHEQEKLGQLPYESFRSAAGRGWIIGAVESADLLGYVLVRPRQRDGVVVITQLCVSPRHRNRGIARRLLDVVADKWPVSPGMVLSCREDYPATASWPRLGFDRIGHKRGRSRAGHRLIRWWRPIDEMSLFTYHASREALPAAALDTDVFRDIVEPREEFEDSIALTADWLSEVIEFVTTAQLGTEIEGAADTNAALRGTSDLFRRLRSAPGQWESFERELTTLLERSAVGGGDRRNLAQAAAGGAQFFVTRDQAMLNKGEVIEDVIGVRVLRPADLALAIYADQFEGAYRTEALNESDYEFSFPARLPTASMLAPFVDVTTDRSATVLARNLGAVVTNVQRQRGRLWELGSAEVGAIGYAGTAVVGEHLIVQVLRVRNHKHRETFARQFLHRFREEAVGARLTCVELAAPVPQSLHPAMMAEGYVPLGERWLGECRRGILRGDDALPGFPLERNVHGLDPGAVSALERRMWPLKILSSRIPTYIVPVKPAWARALFDDALSQMELINRPGHLGLAREHVYYCSLKTTIAAPARILWWVSGGGANGGMRAWSWLDQIAHDRPRTLFKRFGARGIYDQATVESLATRPGQRVTALLFSRSETFADPVGLAAARSLHPAMHQNGYLQTTRRVDEHVFESFLIHGGRYT